MKWLISRQAALAQSRAFLVAVRVNTFMKGSSLVKLCACVMGNAADIGVR